MQPPSPSKAATTAATTAPTGQTAKMTQSSIQMFLKFANLTCQHNQNQPSLINDVQYLLISYQKSKYTLYFE